MIDALISPNANAATMTDRQRHSAAPERLRCVLSWIMRPLLSALVIVVSLTVSGLDTFTGLVGATVLTVLGFIVPVRLYAAAETLVSSLPSRARPRAKRSR